MEDIRKRLEALEVSSSALTGRSSLMEDFDQRLRQLEIEMSQIVLMTRSNSEMLTDIRHHLNKPVNFPAWIGAGAAIMTVFGSLLYGAFIGPLASELNDVKAYELETRAYLRDTGDYAKETRDVLHRHLIANGEEDPKG